LPNNDYDVPPDRGGLVADPDDGIRSVPLRSLLNAVVGFVDRFAKIALCGDAQTVDQPVIHAGVSAADRFRCKKYHIRSSVSLALSCFTGIPFLSNFARGLCQARVRRAFNESIM
jgi:hypothetical protein